MDQKHNERDVKKTYNNKPKEILLVEVMYKYVAVVACSCALAVWLRCWL